MATQKPEWPEVDDLVIVTTENVTEQCDAGLFKRAK
jgi:hypothetical protein